MTDRDEQHLPLNAFFLCVGVLLYAPILVLYLSHTAGVFTLTDLLWPAVLCAASLLIPCLLWRRWPRTLNVLDALVMGPVVYVIGTTTFYAVDGGVLDGGLAPVEKTDRLLHAGLMGLCLVAGVAAAAYAPFRSTCRRFARLLGLLAVAASIYMAVSILPVPHKDAGGRYTSALSPTHNVIVILLDMLQGSFGADYFSRNPDVAARFDGFALYSNTAAFAPVTYLSYSGFMPGGPPGPDQVANGAIREVIDYRNNIVDDMVGQGYTIRHYSNPIPYEITNSKVVKIPDDVGVNKAGDFLAFAILVRKRYLPYRYLPFGLNYWAPLQREFGLVSKRNAKDKFTWFLRNLQVDEHIDKGFVWFHSLVTHSPARFDIEGRYSLTTGPEDVNDELAYVFGLLSQFVDRLKTLGVYDDSLLIVMSDHGYNTLLKMKQLPAEATDYALTPFGTTFTLGQYEPLMMVKKPGAHGSLTYNDSAVTLLDLRKSLREFTSPGSGARMDGFNFLGVERGSPNRTVQVFRFDGARFGNEDFTSLEDWRRDTLQLPLRSNFLRR